MINFIIYCSEINIKNIYTKAVTKYMINKIDRYNFIYIKKYDSNTNSIINNIDGKNIYIIDIEVPGMSGIEFARKIRLTSDWTSPIILCSNTLEFNDKSNKLLTLDYLIKNKDITNNLISSIDVAYNIISSSKSYNFKYTNEYYQVPYKSILYIEKNTCDNYSTLTTKRGKYTIKNSITNILKELNDERFILCSRSCIVNKDNISSIDFSNNIVKFGNESTNLISREGKKNLKDVIEL